MSSTRLLSLWSASATLVRAGDDDFERRRDPRHCSGRSTSRFIAARRLPVVTTKRPFELIVAGYGATVLRVCRAVLGPVDADDAWSETFLSALKAYPELPGDANVEAWLVRIAHRKAIDVTRAAARRPVPVADVPDRPSIPRSDSLDFDLSKALAALSPKQREVVVYHYVAGLTYKDIAAVLGGSADAARRSAADGIAILRQVHPDNALRKGRAQ